MKFFKKLNKKQENAVANSRDAAKERLHLVLMQDRANVSADFLELMKQEIIEVIKKYIDIDEAAIDVRLTNKENEDGTNGAPALYANIPIVNIKNEAKKVQPKEEKKNESKKESVKKEAEKEEKSKSSKDSVKKENNNKEEKKDEKEVKKEQAIVKEDEKNKEDQSEKAEENTEEELKSEN